MFPNTTPGFNAAGQQMTEVSTTTATQQPDLVVRNLEKSYRKRQVVCGVSLSVSRGEIVGLLGKNGAGKTTTFYMIVGLVRPDSGEIIFQGENITRLPVYRRALVGLGYLAQEASVFRKLTVEENILAILETLPMTRAARRERLDELLSWLGLDKVARQKAYTLSGGERRKLEITRALVRNPSILMLDEPFAGVDPIAVSGIQGIVRELRDRGLGVIITDHNVRETLDVVDRAYVLDSGVVVSQGTSDFLVNDPVTRSIYLGEGFKR